MCMCLVGMALTASGVAASELDARRAQVAALKQQAFEQLQVRRAGSLAAAYPERTRLAVYVGLDAESFVLERVKVTVDHGASATRTYTARESANLKGNRLDRVLRANVAPGTHQVRLTFSGRLKESDPDEPPLTGSMALDFEKTERPKALILPAAPELMRQSRTQGGDDWQWRSESADPRLAMVRYLRANQRYLAAAMELVEIAAAGDTPAGYYLLQAHSYIDFGMRRPAREALRTYAARGADRELYENVRLRLAELTLQRGQFRRTQQRLDDMRGNLTPAQRVRWRGLTARLRMTQDRYADAVAILDGGNSAREVLTQPGREDIQTLYMRYNHAIAMLRAGETTRGRTLLDRIGRMQTFSQAQRMLRDQANVKLGYHLLEAGQGATANHIFQRLPLRSPYSPSALLGMGWSEMAPQGSRQKRTVVGDEPEPGTYGIANPEVGRIPGDERAAHLASDAFTKIQLKPFRMADTVQNEKLARRRALALWEVLGKRNVSELAVQEGLVAAGFVLEELGDGHAAMRTYQHATEALAALDERYARNIKSLRRSSPSLPVRKQTDLGRLTRQWHRQHLGGLDRPRWLADLMGSNSVQEALSNARDLQMLALGLRTNLAATPAARAGGYQVQYVATSNAATADDLQTKLRRMARSEMSRLHSVVAQALVQRRERLRVYLSAARRGMARLTTRANREASGSPKSEGATTRAVPNK